MNTPLRLELTLEELTLVLRIRNCSTVNQTIEIERPGLQATIWISEAGSGKRIEYTRLQKHFRQEPPSPRMVSPDAAVVVARESFELVDGVFSLLVGAAQLFQTIPAGAYQVRASYQLRGSLSGELRSNTVDVRLPAANG